MSESMDYRIQFGEIELVLDETEKEQSEKERIQRYGDQIVEALENGVS